MHITSTQSNILAKGVTIKNHIECLLFWLGFLLLERFFFLFLFQLRLDFVQLALVQSLVPKYQEWE